MILFFLDILIYNYTKYNTYLVLLNLNNKKNNYKLIIISLILDFVIFKTYYKNLLIFLIMILINKYLLKTDKNSLVDFLSVNIINDCFFIVLSSILNFNFSFLNMCTIFIDNFLINMVFGLISYKFLLN